VLTILHPSDNDLCMKGSIRTLEKCRVCGGKFVEGRKGFECPTCKTSPRTYYLDLRPLIPKLYRDSTGHVFDSYGRADQELSTIRAEVRKGTFDVRNYVQKEIKALQFEAYAGAWQNRRARAQRQDQISRGYYEVGRGWLLKYLIPFFGQKNIREIREGMIEDFRNWLPEDLKGKTVRNIMGLLHKIFSDAFRRRDIERIPNFPKVEVDEPEIRFIEPEGQDRILAEVQDPTMRALFIFLRYQACRPGEARALQWPKLDFKAGTVTIGAAMDRDRYRARTKERNILVRPLHPEVLAVLKTLPRSLSGYVFVQEGTSRPVSKRQVYEAWRQAARAAGIDITLYAGNRHSFAMQALNAGVNESLLGEFLGHKDRRSIKRYARFQTDTFKAVWERPCPQSVRGPKSTKANIVNLKKEKE
jgi:integrase